jgi:PPOX class probable F420-dependent enzyme
MPAGPLTGAFEGLAGARYVQLTTFRRCGEAVPTPVWPVARDGRIYAVSGASGGKVKRIRANPRVRRPPAPSAVGWSGPP